MRSRTIEIAVGVFILAGIAALLMLSLQVSGLADFFREDKGYKVIAEFTNIGSLKSKAKVSLAGVVIGRVVHIELDPRTFNAKVTLSLDPDASSPLPIDSQASIMTAGLLGDNYIAITPGFNSSEPLKEGSIIPVESTDSAVMLEQLISKFVSNQASSNTVKASEAELPNAEASATSSDSDSNKIPAQSPGTTQSP